MILDDLNVSCGDSLEYGIVLTKKTLCLSKCNHFCVMPNDCHRELGVFEQGKE